MEKELTLIYHGTNNLDDNMTVEKILGYELKDGSLFFKVLFMNKIIASVPFNDLKKDNPLICAQFIRDHVVEKKRFVFFNTWTRATLKSLNRYCRRMKTINDFNYLNILKSRSQRASKMHRMTTKLSAKIWHQNPKICQRSI
mmetsp:Transcript_33830/g.41499  ORF Transcript_33830/g.41499 Transcript_33830/m.41499 type:complete len:142 (+) Transcript_33830:737-1162(+)